MSRFEWHSKFRVSAKLALYSNDLTSVLLMHYPRRNFYGLPGGHVEKKEQPDDTIRREILEELGLQLGDVKQAGFFATEKIILGYTAIAPADVVIAPPHPEFEYGVWIKKEDLAGIDMNQKYIQFAIDNWPNQ